jgi:alkylation response protein AidB-like acyl-CoA dehydrogenase
VNLLPTPEQQEISAAAAGLLSKELQTETGDLRRELWSAEQGLWRQCAELGWLGLGLPEDQGGIGYGMAEEVLLFREIGRHLAPGPYLAATLGARVAAGGGASDLAASVLAGDAIVALAEPRHADFEVGPVVRGSFDLIDAIGASHVIVVTSTSTALLPVDELGTRQELPCIDPTAHLERVTTDGARAVVHVAEDDGRNFARGSVLSSAMLIGIAEATRDTASEYSKVREQFGKPIGVHQAIKHRCADMAVRAEAATSQVFFAAACIDDGRADTSFQAACAKVMASDSAISNAAANIQIHGGMGNTYEFDAHLFLKRAHLLDRMIGDRRLHLGQLLELPAAQ